MADLAYTIEVIIEAPSGDTNRYAYDTEAHVFTLIEVIYAPAPLPAEFGAVVGTLTDADTPLGAVIIAGAPIVAGAVVSARPIGGIEVVRQDNRANYVVAVPAVDNALEHIQDIHDLPPERVTSLERFLQTYGAPAGARQTVHRQNAREIRRTIERARRMGRMARIGERGRATITRAWQALVEGESTPSATETAPYTVAELSLTKLPYRFQTYVGQMLLPDERILFFVERPPIQRARGLFSRSHSLPEGLLVVTTQQVLWMYDALPPTATLVGYGYIAKTFVLARLVQVELHEADDLVQLHLVVGDTGGGQEASAIAFPRRRMPELRRVVDYLKGFSPAAHKAPLLCLTEMKATEEKLADLVESGDEKTAAHLPGLLKGLQASLADDEFVVEQALVPAWATDNGHPKLVAATDRQMFILSFTRHGDVECDKIPFGTIASLELSHSVMECWLRVLLPDTQTAHPIQVNLPLVALGQFRQVFLALRRGLTAPAAYTPVVSDASPLKSL